MTARLVLVRHGESRWNVEQRYQGHEDSGLTAVGLAQASAAAAVLADRYGRAGLVVTSDLPRAGDTAAAYLRRVGGDVTVDPRLREIDVGSWGGRPYDEVAAEFPEQVAAAARGEDFRRPGGETYAELRARVWAALVSAAGLGAETVVVFTHGGPIRMATAAAMDLPPGGHRLLAPVANCSLTVLQYDPHALLSYNAPAAE